jgi:hypothetical protein
MKHVAFFFVMKQMNSEQYVPYFTDRDMLQIDALSWVRYRAMEIKWRQDHLQYVQLFIAINVTFVRNGGKNISRVGCERNYASTTLTRNAREQVSEARKFERNFRKFDKYGETYLRSRDFYWWVKHDPRVQIFSQTTTYSFNCCRTTTGSFVPDHHCAWVSL